MKSNTTLTVLKTLIAGSALALVSSQSFAAVPPNVATLGTASESSNYQNPYAGVAHAIDGNTDGQFGDGSVTHTKYDSGNGVGTGFAWWSVKLDKEYLVSSIDVWNRTDCCSNRLRDFTVTMFDQGSSVWSSIYSAAEGPAPSSSFAIGTNGIVGDQVRVQLNRQDYLSLAEVQVYGVNPVAAVPEPETYALLLAGLGALGFVARRRKPL